MKARFKRAFRRRLVLRSRGHTSAVGGLKQCRGGGLCCHGRSEYARAAGMTRNIRAKIG